MDNAKKMIFVVDPSFFTLPYDNELCKALGTISSLEVVLIGRPLRKGERIKNENFVFLPLFFKTSENLKSSDNKFISTSAKYFKSIEYAFNWLKLLRLIRTKNPAVIHFEWLPLPPVDYVFLKKIKNLSKIIVTVHDTEPFHNQPTSSWQLRGWLKTLSLAETIIVHTKFSKNRLIQKNIPPSKIGIIPHGLLDFGTDHVGKTRNINYEFRILFFGAIKRYKGLDLLVEAFNRFKKTDDRKYILTIVGKSHENASNLRTLHTNPEDCQKEIVWDLRFFNDEELPGILGSADLAVFPYRDIDGSGALMTAIFYEIPFICSDIDGFVEIVGRDSILTFKKDSTASLADKLERVTSDIKILDKIKKEVLAVKSKVPSWIEIAEITKSIYEKK